MGAFFNKSSKLKMTDEELMTAFQAGDSESLGQLFENLQGSLVSFAASRVSKGRSGKQQLAQDAVQNAFTKVIANVNGNGAWRPGRASVSSWLRMIVAQQVVELTRKKSGSEKVCTDFDTADQPCYSVEQLENLPNRFGHDFDSIVEKVSRLMPPELKLVVQMILEGLSRKEIADQLGISEPTVCRRRYAAQAYFEDFDFGLAA